MQDSNTSAVIEGKRRDGAFAHTAEGARQHFPKKLRIPKRNGFQCSSVYLSMASPSGYKNSLDAIGHSQLVGSCRSSGGVDDKLNGFADSRSIA